MELIEDTEYFVIQRLLPNVAQATPDSSTLWCSRIDGSITARPGKDICLLSKKHICRGQIYGVIGKFRIGQDSDWRLLLIRQQIPVGTLPGNKDVYKISKIIILTLSQSNQANKDLDIDPCSMHSSSASLFASSSSTSSASSSSSINTTRSSSHVTTSSVSETMASQSRSLQKKWNQFKQAAENIKPKKLAFLGDLVGSQGSSQAQKDVKEKEKFERKVLLSFTTNNSSKDQFSSPPFWEMADDRFFWNKNMLQDLIDSKSDLCKPWLIPIIQGFVQIEVCPITFDDEFDSVSSNNKDSNETQQSQQPQLSFKLCLISRRSRFRAGTRYKKRGVDEEGRTANYVETEQILDFSGHVNSFVQVRGSVPLFWSQTGIKYKPPPRIERGEEENHLAFCRHFDEQLQLYKNVTAVCLVDRLGKEKVIADAFLKHIQFYNNSLISYVAFDFHEYCRGMRFENVSLLTENIMDMIRDMRYCWVDVNGTICEQSGVFRINCIDCLDRTNIVQSAIARLVLEIQCRKLGLLSPERQLAPTYRTLYQQMWANNGDIISRQYAGTAALKGDYTRTGERRFAGLMKDGVNSANRYYINRVKDYYRQATIDLMLGNATMDDIRLMLDKKSVEESALLEEDDTEVLVQKEENLKVLIDECKKMLITEEDECLGGWGLIDCEELAEDPSQQDMDIILLLSQRAYYIAHYDDEKDQVTGYQEILLSDLDKIEIGVLSLSSKSRQMCIRIHYSNDSDHFFHTFCTTNTRLFNNVVVVIRNEEEAKESLRAIAESFLAAKKLMNGDVNIIENKLERKSSRPHHGIIDIACQAQEQVESSLPRPNISRDNSSHSLRTVAVSPSMHRKNSPSASPRSTPRVLHPAPAPLPPSPGVGSTVPLTKLGSIGRAMADMIPVKKIQLNSLKMKMTKMPRLLPSVIYNKGSGSDYQIDDLDDYFNPSSVASDRHDSPKRHTISTTRSNRTERPGHILFTTDTKSHDTCGVPIGGGVELLSSSESELSSSELEISTHGYHQDVVLKSCGILTTSTKQVIATLLECGRSNQTAAARGTQVSHVIDGLSDCESSLGNEERLNTKDTLARKKAVLIAQFKSKSLDIDECLRKKPFRVAASNFHNPDNSDSCTTQATGMAAVAQTDEDLINFDASVEETQDETCPISFTAHDTRNKVKTVSSQSQAAWNATMSNKRKSVHDDDDDNDESTEVENNPLHIANKDSHNVNGVEYGKNHEITGEFKPTIMVDGEEVSGAKHPPPLERRRSLLKISYSEGALANTLVVGGAGNQGADSLTFDGDDLDDLDPDTLSREGSAFSKLRVKMANLAIPAMSHPVAMQKQLQQTVKNNALRSRLRFRECKTRILLL